MSKFLKATVTAVIGLALFVNTANAKSWHVLANDPTAAITVNKHASANGNYYVVFMVEFMSSMDCLPEFSLVMSKDPALRGPQGQDWIDSKMSVWADGDLVAQEKTAAAKYDNGLSWASFGSEVAIAKLVSADEIGVKPMAEANVFSFLTDGMGSAVSKARSACD